MSRADRNFKALVRPKEKAGQHVNERGSSRSTVGGRGKGKVPLLLVVKFWPIGVSKSSHSTTLQAATYQIELPKCEKCTGDLQKHTKEHNNPAL